MKTIETLHLGLHDCTVKGVRAFADGMKTNYSLTSVWFGGKHHSRFVDSRYVTPAMGGVGFEKEFHEIEYYARMNRKGRRCLGREKPLDPVLWPLVLERAQKEETGRGLFDRGDVREFDYFVGHDYETWSDTFGSDADTKAGLYDTSIDAIFYLMRDVFTL